MVWIHFLFIAVPMILAVDFVSSDKDTDWAASAQKTIYEASLVMDRATIGLDSFVKKATPMTVQLSKATAKMAGMFGVFGSIFSIILGFIPGSESPEMKLMKSEFGKLSQKVDTIARSLDDTKNLIRLEAQRAVYIDNEEKIHHGFSQLEKCLKKLDSVTCSSMKECKRKKVLIAEGYVKSMDVLESVESILQGVTSDTAFGESLLNLLREKSKCNVPKINLLANKVTALITKGMAVSMFYDLLTKADYNILDSTVLADKMLRILESRRQFIQHRCFREMNYRMPVDIQNSHEHYTSDIQNTNTKLLRTLKTKYSWIWWHVLTYKGEEPKTGPSNAARRLLYSSSKQHKVHCFVIPTNTTKVQYIDEKIKEWKRIINVISTDAAKAKAEIENKVKKDLTLNNQIQSFALLSGQRWIVGHFKDTLKQYRLGVNDVQASNVFVTRPPQGYVVVVSFVQADYPPKCSEKCNDKGKCYLYPYSTQMGCRCNAGHSGEKCGSSSNSLQLKSVINSILQKTMTLPTFATIQHSIQNTQLYLKTSTENIQKSIMRLGKIIDQQFRSLGSLCQRSLNGLLFC